MRYFEKFPMIWHTVSTNQGDDQVLLTNITRRVTVVRKITGLERALLPYKIQEKETPRQFAQRVYGSFELFWVVLLINQISNINKDWPKSSEVLTEELRQAYGEKYHQVIHHIETPDGKETDIESIRWHNSIDDNVSDDQIVSEYGLRTVSVYDFYFHENEKKREIKVLDPEYLSIFVDQLERELK